jgi:hypothetical protein
MKQTTTWRPDTCDCEIEYEWDDTLSEVQRTHAIKQFNHKCSFHQKADDTIQYGDVVEENTRKNKTISEIVNVLGADSVKPGDLEWSFDGSRNLTVNTNNRLGAAERISVEIEVAKFSDKVTIA